ncbi:hypothetical protein PQH03_28180 [Ralstonia insidiosa]|jgi:hypothetical protein|uniref:Uncharacterized protein n=2 Tax=Burkholderiaceae TaxID=119060 RepID=A0A192A7H3_9RALS|nr:MULTISPECIES: hypothetical protein [Ralstonia]KMW44885.1 hypothetical protein AC240_23305 [Ralstonia sp. MD27]ANJ76252.1 hypothetical protein A9Y76_26960 [Ralstonia insidiosa]MBA9869561.1 hypothetical protein [Ralstonia insidiosa]MBA9913730.1 hypothetical protein [Ralstonia insidiosa]MBA9952557.1 hypothetical protein [Ralstonia insidiosa]
MSNKAFISDWTKVIHSLPMDSAAEQVHESKMQQGGQGTPEAFAVGDTVTWTSQSSGYTRTKKGVIEEVVPTQGKPNRDQFPQLYRSAGVGAPRNHVSYVVRVAGKTAKSAGTVYWPRSAGLKKM